MESVKTRKARRRWWWLRDGEAIDSSCVLHVFELTDRDGRRARAKTRICGVNIARNLYLLHFFVFAVTTSNPLQYAV